MILIRAKSSYSDSNSEREKNVLEVTYGQTGGWRLSQSFLRVVKEQVAVQEVTQGNLQNMYNKYGHIKYVLRMSRERFGSWKQSKHSKINFL